MQYVYVSYNTLTRTYSAPVVRDADPKNYGKQLSDFIVLYPDKAKEERLEETVIYVIGTFDQETGKINFTYPDQSGEVVLDCIQTIKQLEALKNAVKPNN